MSYIFTFDRLLNLLDFFGPSSLLVYGFFYSMSFNADPHADTMTHIAT